MIENLVTRMFIKVLFILSENWKVHNFLEMGDWLNNHDMSYYNTLISIKKNKTKKSLEEASQCSLR